MESVNSAESFSGENADKKVKITEIKFLFSLVAPCERQDYKQIGARHGVPAPNQSKLTPKPKIILIKMTQNGSEIFVL